jgi:hypothetical protein
MQASQIIFIQVIERPCRKMIIARGKKSTHYFEFCEEVGCDVWGKLVAVKNAICEPVGMWMPDDFRPEGTSLYAQGVEVPADYRGPVPEGMSVIDLPACHYLYFRSQPYAEENMAQIVEMVQKSMGSYDPEFYGWRWADNDAPRIQFPPMGTRGYIEARPVRALKK